MMSVPPNFPILPPNLRAAAKGDAAREQVLQQPWKRKLNGVGVTENFVKKIKDFLQIPGAAEIEQHQRRRGFGRGFARGHAPLRVEVLI
jgi:hypothetical protein